MNKGKILAAIGAVLVLIGVYAIIAAVPATNGTQDITLPAGNQYYYFLKTSSLINGGIEGSYEVSSGASVSVKVFSQSEYDVFTTTGAGTPIMSTSGQSASFSGSPGGTGRVFVVFEHLSADAAESSIHVTYKITGIGLTPLIAGIVLLIVGAVLVLFGTRMIKKQPVAATPPQVASDVTILKQ